MKQKFSIILICLLFPLSLLAQESLTIKVKEGELWWGALTNRGRVMPLHDGPIEFNTRISQEGNQGVPFLISNKGRYIWSNSPFQLQFANGVININSEVDHVAVIESGSTLKETFKAAAERHFPSSGKLPNENFFTKPQYNTWIELVYNQNQEDVLQYARNLIDNGYPAGVLMIDDNWQQQYGNYDFRPDKFPDPKAMVDQLHAMGFDVMLWISPFVSPDGAEYRALKKKGYLLKSQSSTHQPAIFNWWNGYSAAYDLSNPDCFEFVKSELERLQKKYGIDGYKFDAGDSHHYMTAPFVDNNGNTEAYIHTELWAKLGLNFEFNEYRACWKMAGEALVQRLRDKKYEWEALPILITDILNAGIMGYAYTCPDMIGGGEFSSFFDVDPADMDQELIVRSCQIHALMPMMQFSVAPWRILDNQHAEICKKYACLHEEFGPYILELANHAAKSGEPIVRYMEYEFPGQGLEDCVDQFMLGSKYLVAPMITKGTKRCVALPKGNWRDETGKKYKGGKVYEIDVPIQRLPLFERL